MPSIRIGGAVGHPYGDADGTRAPANGSVRYYRRHALPVGGVAAGPGSVRKAIRDGVAEWATLDPGEWVAEISLEGPGSTGTRWSTPLVLTEDMTEETLADHVVVELDGIDLVRGDPGPSVTGAVDNGDQTVTFTLSDGAELPPVTLPPGPAGHGVGVNVTRIRKGLLSIHGPSVARLKKGLVVVHNSAPPGAPAWSTNPLALMAGRSISSLWYDSVDGMIYSGYGDWNSNSDEVGVVRHRVSTGDAEIVYFPENGQSEYQPDFRRRGAWTEAIETFYRFGDAIYIPHTDGAGYWEGCGYITNEGGEWHEVSLPGQALHVFDMAQTSEGMWAVGSAIYASQADAGATLWFRPTGGDWTIRYQADTKGMGFSRFYQIRVEDDRAWVHDSVSMASVGAGQAAYVVYGFNATDMESRDVRSGEHWGRNITDQITVGEYTYRGGPMGKITKERKR